MPGALGCNPFIRKVFDLTNTISNERFEFIKIIRWIRHLNIQIIRLKPLRIVSCYKNKKTICRRWFFMWELRDSNPRPSACKADALNQLS